MQPHSPLYVLIFAALAQLTGWLAVSAYRRPGRPGPGAFVPLMVAMTERSVAAIFEYFTPTLAGKLLAEQLEFVGFAAIGPLWLALALEYTGRAHLLTRRIQILLALPSMLTAALALTNEAHHLIWANAALNPAGFPALSVENGPWGIVYSLLNYAYLLAGAVFYVEAFTRASRRYRRQSAYMLAGALVPLAGHAVTLAGLFPMFQYDLSEVSLPIAAGVLALGLFRYGRPELTPVAARTVMDNLREPVIVLDTAQRLIDLNSSARRLFGLDDESLGRPAREVLPLPQIWQAGVKGAEAQDEIQIGAAGGWYKLTLSPLRDSRDRGLGSVVLLHDVSQQRALLRMRDDLTHMLVHDLRNPFSSIYSAIQLIDALLKEEPVAQPEGKGSPGFPRSKALYGAIEIALQSSMRAQEMLDSLLDLNRLEGGQMPMTPAPLEPGEVARMVVHEMSASALRRGITLDLAVPEDLPMGYADDNLLDRVLRNLIGNAIKFTPSGGCVNLAAHAENSSIVLSVTDDGPGIPELVKSRLFEKFVRGPGPVQGSGLGLAFCRLAVETMGGRIWAEGAPDHGTTFHFTIPQALKSIDGAMTPILDDRRQTTGDRRRTTGDRRK